MSTNKPVGGAQFTPGPWHLEYDVDGIPLTIIGSDNSAVGTVETWNDHADGNRNLIAAAPAMYEALRMLTSEINLSTLNVRKDFSLMNAHACAVKAILQAEGKLL